MALQKLYTGACNFLCIIHCIVNMVCLCFRNETVRQFIELLLTFCSKLFLRNDVDGGSPGSRKEYREGDPNFSKTGGTGSHFSEKLGMGSPISWYPCGCKHHRVVMQSKGQSTKARAYIPINAAHKEEIYPQMSCTLCHKTMVRVQVEQVQESMQ